MEAYMDHAATTKICPAAKEKNNSGKQIREAFPDTRSRLEEQGGGSGERARGGECHIGLLRARFHAQAGFQPRGIPGENALRKRNCLRSAQGNARLKTFAEIKHV